MAIIEVVCPCCGGETKATKSPGSTFGGVETEAWDTSGGEYNRSENTCKKCGGTFYSFYKE